MKRSLATLVLVALLAAPALAQENVDTGFQPARDGFPFTNGDFASGGMCMGMSLMSSWWFNKRQELPFLPPFTQALSGLRGNTPAEADLFGREVALMAQDSIGAPYTDGTLASFEHTNPAGLTATGTDAVNRLASTKQPQVLVLRRNDGFSHAVVATGYKDGAIQTFDPNYPNETIAIPFTNAGGFGPHPKYGTLNDVAHANPDEWAKHVPYVEILAKSLLAQSPVAQTVLGNDGHTTEDRYKKIDLDGLPMKDGVAKLDGDRLKTGGRVTGGDASGAPVTKLDAYVNGVKVPGLEVPVDGDGKFSIDLDLGLVKKALAAAKKVLPESFAKDLDKPVVSLVALSGTDYGFAGVKKFTLDLSDGTNPGAQGATPAKNCRPNRRGLVQVLEGIGGAVGQVETNPAPVAKSTPRSSRPTSKPVAKPAFDAPLGD